MKKIKGELFILVCSSRGRGHYIETGTKLEKLKSTAKRCRSAGMYPILKSITTGREIIRGSKEFV